MKLLLTIVRHWDLLPHFLTHYLSMGVEEYLVSLNPKDRPAIMSEVPTVFARYPVKATFLKATPAEELSGRDATAHERLRRSHARPDEWIIPADLDEFNQYPLPLRELVSRMEADGYAYLYGRFSDRVARDGTTQAVRPDVPIWEQYPVEAKVTEKLARAVCNKVMLCRGSCVLNRGHHYVESASAGLAYPTQGVVHHFKWHDGCIATLLARREAMRMAGDACWPESHNVYEFLRIHGRFKLDDLLLEAREGWRPRASGTEGQASA